MADENIGEVQLRNFISERQAQKDVMETTIEVAPVELLAAEWTFENKIESRALLETLCEIENEIKELNNRLKPLIRDDAEFSYIVIYTYASTQGVILDVVPDGSAETFINSSKKFISRRGCPAKILSDTGGVFVVDITQKFVSFRNVKWNFSLKEAPWYGGFWRSLVGQLKRCLKKTIGRAYLNFYELQTVINEVELVLNSRPLGVLHDDDLEELLTLNHILYGR